MPVKRLITIPNLLSLIRLMCALVMLVLAWLGHPCTPLGFPVDPEV